MNRASDGRSRDGDKINFEAVKHKPGVIVITGASSGIGRATANLFAQQGWRIGLIARSDAGLRAVRDDVEQKGSTATAIQADVVDSPALDDAADTIERALGPIDIWVNCAGNGTYGRFLDTPDEEFRRVTEVTYLGTVNGTRAALRHMRPRDYGRIVNVCSAVAYRGMPLLASYSGAKHAVRGFGQSICAELVQERSRVRLTTIFPPAVNTPFFTSAVSHMRWPGRPIPPVYQPEIIAEAIRLAALTGRRELPVSFVTVLFALGVRLVPNLVDRAIQRLGYSGQLTTDESIFPMPRITTLFAPSDQPSPIRGVFDAEAKSRSLHVSLLGLAARLGQRRMPSTEAAIEAPSEELV